MFVALSLLIVLFGLIFLSVPIAVALGISTTVNLIIFTDMDLLFIGQNIYAALGNYTFLAIPFFILASNIMSEGGIARRLIGFSEALTGGITGGLGMAGVLACAFFAAISGSSAATVMAVGTIMIPGMVKEGYDIRFATGLIACSGSLGILIPPSILMIIFGVLADVSIGRLFAAGMLPGMILCMILMAYVYVVAKRKGYPPSPSLSMKERFNKMTVNGSSLLIPVIILGGIYGGVVTPTEAATLAVFLGLVMGFFLYRELKLKSMPKILIDSAEMSSMILIILAFAYSFAFLLSFFRIPDLLTHMMFDAGVSPWMFLICLNVILLLAGQFMDPASIMLIFTPLIVSLGSALDINLVHLGVVVTMNLEIGLISPPVGFNIYVGRALSKLPLYDVMKSTLPILVVMICFLVVVTYVPWISLVIPNLFFG